MELIDQLTSNLGVNETQAKGGAGLLFKLAKDGLSGGISPKSLLPFRELMDLSGPHRVVKVHWVVSVRFLEGVAWVVWPVWPVGSRISAWMPV